MPRVTTSSSNKIYSQAAAQFWGAWFIAIIWNGIALCPFIGLFALNPTIGQAGGRWLGSITLLILPKDIFER